MSEQITLEIPHWKSAITGWLRERLEAEFPTVGGIYDENQHFEPPEATTDQLASSWFFVEINAVDSRKVELGTNGEWRTTGNVFVACRTPRYIGTGQADEMASAVERIFRGTTAGYVGLVFRDSNGQGPSSRSLRTSDEYFQVTVTCPFQVRAPQN